MKKRVFILFFGVILSCGITAGILTTGFVAKYMMQKMIILLNQKKIDKMSFPKNIGTNIRSVSSIHSDSQWGFEYAATGEKGLLKISFFYLEGEDLEGDAYSLFRIINRDGISENGIYELDVHIDVYDKNDMMLVSNDRSIYAHTSSLIKQLKTVFLLLSMNEKSAWEDVLDKYDIGRIKVTYGSNTFNLKLVDNSSPYSTIEQIRQLSFWVKCPESQLNDIGKKYDVWK